MTQSVFAMGKVGGGQLSLGPKPSVDQLESWVRALREVGVTHVVCLITQAEIETHSLNGEAQSLADHDIGFTHFPVDDFHTPDTALFRDLNADLKARLQAGEHLFLHCAGGVGRAGTTASCLLVEFGHDPDTAMQTVSTVRGKTCPETPDQIDFIRNWKF